MKITRYNAKDCTVVVTVDGTPVHITQLGEDMVSFEKEEGYFEPSVGAQGDIVKNEINNSIHTLTITVQATSPQKNFLLGLCGKEGDFKVWVTHSGLNERFGGNHAAIQEMPEISRGAEAEDMEFSITVFDGVVETIN